jgi:REP element-mobilizing transposase RayT
MAEEFTIWSRNLPHWRWLGATYFITFRLARGSLDPAERQIVLDACRYWHERKHEPEAVVVLPDHVHILARLVEGDRNAGHHSAQLSRIMHSIKSFTAHEIGRKRGRTGALWLDEHYDRIVRNQADFAEKLNYLANNPVKAGLCRDYVQYPFFWYPGKDGSPHRRDPSAGSGQAPGATGKGAEHRRDAGATGTGPEHRRDAGATET